MLNEKKTQSQMLTYYMILFIKYSQTKVSKVMSLLFNMLSRLGITFLPRSKRLNFMAAVTICSDFGAPKSRVCHGFHCFPIYLPWSDGPDAMIFVFWMLSFKPDFSLSSFTFMKRLFSSLLSAISVMESASKVIDFSPDNLDSSFHCIQPSI